MKRILKIGGAVVAVFLLLLLGLNLLISAEWIEARVAARVMEQTDRELKVNGSTSLFFTPNPHIVITDATITDPTARKGSADLAVEKIAIDLSFGELLSQKIDANSVTLVRPMLTVRLGHGDAPQRTDAGAPVKHAAKQRPFIAAQTVVAQKPRARDVRLEHVEIEDGTVEIVYDDKGTERRIEHIDATVRLPEITAPLTADGKLEWKGENVRFSAELTSPAELRAARPATLQVALDAESIAARFDGKLSTRPEFTGEGELSAKAHSIPSLLAWMRQSTPSAMAIGDGELASHVSWTPDQINLSAARFALEHAQGQGQAVVTLRKPRPHIRAAFGLERLDLNPFLAGRSSSPAAPEAAPEPNETVAPAPTSGAEEQAQSWFDKPDATAGSDAPETSEPAPVPANPDVAAAPQQSSAPPKSSGPAAFDADINLNIRQSRVGHLEIGPTALGLGYREGVLTATLGGMELYEGNGRGTFVLDAREPVSTFSGDLILEGVQAKTLLSDAAQFSMLSGSTKLNLAVKGSGKDSDGIKSSLSGQGSFVVSDGTLEGIDIPGLLNQVGSGEIPESLQSPGAKTSFTDLGGSFTIANGIVDTDNLQMKSALLEVKAAGQVDLPQSTIDILAHPQIVAAPEGKKGANDLAGLTIPVRIAGPLEQPTIKPEIGGLFADPEKASKTVNQIGEVIRKKFKGKPVGEALGRFLGNVQIGPRGEEDAAPSDEDAPAAERESRAAPAPRPPRQTRAAPRKPAPAEESEAGQGDGGTTEEPMDPDLEQILR